ncbi:metallophosphoesterase domain-containing protein 1 [Pilatotrama ljubarskyi]|nr:metallophosphoesterase domain-containing protein 1 [Pilatotrama ljubarskyi]
MLSEGGLDAIVKRRTRTPTTWEQFCYSPILFVTRRAYKAYTEKVASVSNSSCNESLVRVVCISDTHNGHDHVPPLPAGDVLVHAGDLTQSGTEKEIRSALEWLSSAPHPHKVLIAGNHDTALATPNTCSAILDAFPDLIYLQDSSATLTIRGRQIIVYGSPRTPRHGSGVFQYPRGEADWNIPSDVDILVTHGPPMAHLDLKRLGCKELLQALWHVQPRLHVFGHLHGGRGVERASWCPVQRAYEDVCTGRVGWLAALTVVHAAIRSKLGRPQRTLGDSTTTFVNASSLGGQRDELVREAIVVDMSFPS